MRDLDGDRENPSLTRVLSDGVVRGCLEVVGRGAVSVDEIAEELKLTERTVRGRVEVMVDQGLIEEVPAIGVDVEPRFRPVDEKIWELDL